MNIVRLKEVNSTNMYAKINLADLPDRTVICADRQTAGRGRFERIWVDLGCDNIFMSIVLKPSNEFLKVYPNLTQYMAVVICKTLELYGVKPSIKWPNDVLISSKKIAGILSETVMQGKDMKGLVLGAGININSDKNSISLIPDRCVTALNLEIGQKIAKDKFISDLLAEFFKNYDEFLDEGFQMIKDEYIKRACFLDKNISVQVFNETKSGIARTVNDDGELVLENNNKELVLTMGDIL